MFTLLLYPKCSTCQRIAAYLRSKGVNFQERHIVEHCPSQDELRQWLTLSGLEAKAFFNTSGLRYRALNLKERLPKLTVDEQLTLLASDGMLIKRPILVSEQGVWVGRQIEKAF